MSVSRAFFLLVTILAVTISCNYPDAVAKDEGVATTATVDAIYSATICNGKGADATITRVTDSIGLKKLFSRLKAHIINGNLESPVNTDFSKNALFLIETGVKRTAGYGITLASKGVRTEGDIAFISTLWQEPQKDAILAQIITSPCLLVAVPKGRYHRVKVVDQNKKIRAEIGME